MAILTNSGFIPTSYSATLQVPPPLSGEGETSTSIRALFGGSFTPPEIDVVFNGVLHAPGYTITLTNMNQLLESGQYIQYWNLKRKSPNLSLWPDEIVRGADFIKEGSLGQSAFIIEDFEAPFLSGADDWEYILEVYTDVDIRAYELDISMMIPQLDNFVDTDPGQVYLKVIDDVLLSRYVFIREFKSWKRPGHILNNSAVLGRKNRVVLTDVVKGKEGSFKIIVMTNDGDPSIQSNVFNIEEALETGGTILIQSTNYLSSGFKDIYCKIDGMSIDRSTIFDPETEETIFTVSVGFIEVDRPGTSTSVSFRTWQQVLDSNSSWNDVLNKHDDWLSVLLNPTL